MNTYPTTGEQLYMEQQMRNYNSCKEYMVESRVIPKTKKQEKKLEEICKKEKEGRIAGYNSKRYDYPEYVWWMIQDGKKYHRSSNSDRVYDYNESSKVVGTWNEEEQRIHFIDVDLKIQELTKQIEFLQQQLVR